MTDLHQRRNLRLTAALAVVALAVAGLLLVARAAPRTVRLRLTAGDPLGKRHALAEALARTAKDQGVALELVPSAGSEEALQLVERGEVDLALVQGGLEAGEHVRQVAGLVPEPLHLLARPGLAQGGLPALRGKRLSLGPAGSGTHRLALDVLRFADLEPGRDFVVEGRSYAELETIDEAALPDGVFMVSQLLSPVARDLIHRRGYRLVPLPFGDAMGLREASIEAATIPPFAYGVEPAVPAEPCPTVATRLLLVAHQRVPEAAVGKLLDVVFGGAFARAAELAALPTELLQRTSDIRPHPGTQAWLRRTEPFVTHEAIDNIESLRSFFVSCAVAAFLLWRWTIRRRSLGFEAYFAEVTRLEQRALDLERASRFDLKALLELRRRLSAIKVEALERFSSGQLAGEELMASFLTHVTDVRNDLSRMILHERDRMEEEARLPDVEGDERRLDAMWNEALGEGPPPPPGPTT